MIIFSYRHLRRCIFLVAFFLSCSAAAAADFSWTLFLPAILGSYQVTPECVTGRWDITYDWSCNDANEAYVWNWVYDDATWANKRAAGTWSLSGTEFKFVYGDDKVGTVYTGTVNSSCDTMTGTMESYNGGTGCWTAERVQSSSN